MATNSRNTTKKVNLALQGGGAHGAFTWGVLDKILEDGRLEIDGVSATSAGSMNAAVYAYGNMIGGHDGAREALHKFWENISEAGQLHSPVKLLPWERLWGNNPVENSVSFWLFETWTHAFSPYQFNPFDFNPLRDVLSKSVDFEQIHRCKCTNLFINATNVRTGKLRVFRNEEITQEVILASACLPVLFQAVEVGNTYYWDGGYMGNPALFPLFYEADSRDIIVVHINPMFRYDIPTTAPDIADRINEISFNSSLLAEFRAIAFVTKLVDEGWLKDEHRSKFKQILVHSIKADEALDGLTIASKFNCDWDFLTDLRDKGRATAEQWLGENFIHLNKRSTVDVRAEYLGMGDQDGG